MIILFGAALVCSLHTFLAETKSRPKAACCWLDQILLPFAIHVLVILIKERHHLSSQALALGLEGVVVVACDYLHLGCPDRCLVEVVFALDISELASLGFGLRFVRHPPEERYRLGSGADALRVELVLRYACGDALFDGPEDGLVEIIRLLYVSKLTGCRL